MLISLVPSRSPLARSTWREMSWRRRVSRPDWRMRSFGDVTFRAGSSEREEHAWVLG